MVGVVIHIRSQVREPEDVASQSEHSQQGHCHPQVPRYAGEGNTSPVHEPHLHCESELLKENTKNDLVDLSPFCVLGQAH